MTRFAQQLSSRTSRRLLAAVFCASAAALVTWAQSPPAPAVGQVNPQVNTALYGGGVPASVRYASAQANSVALPSEVRYAYWKSGALPSDIRMGYAAIGPLAPGGAMSYIPSATPSYLPQPSTAPPRAMGSAAYSNASIRYSTPAAAPSTAYVAPRAMPSQQVSPALVSRGPVNAGPINTGTVRYSR